MLSELGLVAYTPRHPCCLPLAQVRLQINAASPEYIMPSLFAESTAHESAESVPEPTGPSKLPCPIDALDPTPEPTATVLSSIPEPALAVAIAK